MQVKTLTISNFSIFYFKNRRKKGKRENNKRNIRKRHNTDKTQTFEIKHLVGTLLVQQQIFVEGRQHQR